MVGDDSGGGREGGVVAAAAAKLLRQNGEDDELSGADDGPPAAGINATHPRRTAAAISTDRKCGVGSHLLLCLGVAIEVEMHRCNEIRWRRVGAINLVGGGGSGGATRGVDDQWGMGCCKEEDQWLGCR